MTHVICIRGTPGVGKTTLAKLLSRQWLAVIIEVDAVRSMVASPNWLDQAEHKKALNIAAAMTAAFHGEGFHPILVVDTFSKGKLVPFVESIRELLPQSVSISCISLWAEDAVLRRRIEQRHTSQFRDIGISLAMNGEYGLPAIDGEYLIDTSPFPPESVAEEVHRRLELGTGTKHRQPVGAP